MSKDSISSTQTLRAELSAYRESGKKWGNISDQTRNILNLLYAKHEPQEWATFREFWVDGRIVDFFAVNLWSSRRFNRVAYEVKVSRADFAKELSNPAKREPAEQLANECYFVAPHGLIDPKELPENWGLYEVTKDGSSLRKKTHAKWRDVPAPPMDIVAGMARRASDRPAEVPQSLWSYEGQEMGWAQIKEVARSLGIITRIYDDVRAEQEERIKNDHTNQRKERIVAAVEKVFDYSAINGDFFENYLRRLVHRDGVVSRLVDLFPGYHDTEGLLQGMKAQIEVVGAFFGLEKGYSLEQLKRAAELATKPNFNAGHIMMLKAMKNNVTTLLRLLGHE